MRLRIETPLNVSPHVLLGTVRQDSGLELQLVLGRYSAHPGLPLVRALEVCADGSTSVFAILTSGAPDLQGKLLPWQIAFNNRQSLTPAAQRAVLLSGLFMPTGCVTGPQRLPVWRIDAQRLPQSARMEAQRLLGWQPQVVAERVAANDEVLADEERDRARGG